MKRFVIPCVSVVLIATASGAQVTSPPRYKLLDAVVFWATPFADQYEVKVRSELQRFMQRAATYRPRPRPAGLGSEMTMVYAAREGYEKKLVAGASTVGVERLAQQYVDDLRPCYEWEGFHDCPEREAQFAEQYLSKNPTSPFREFLTLLAAHRWLCAAEGYKYEEEPAGETRSRRAGQPHLSAALKAQSILIRTAAEELRTRGGCHQTGG